MGWWNPSGLSASRKLLPSLLLPNLKQFTSRQPCIKYRCSMSAHPRQPSTTSLIEEETIPFYKQEQFYPFHIGELLNSRYKILGKLGYGAYSTTWLCRDVHQDYTAIKVLGSTPSTPQYSREIKAYEHLSNLPESQHLGSAYIRYLYDTFDISVPHGPYQCFVHPPMHMSIHELRMLARSRKFSEDLLKQTLICLLRALDFLHSEAGIIHCDIKASNIMLCVADERVLTEFEEAEKEDPSPRKIVDDTRTVYRSRKLTIPKNCSWGRPVLCDLGEARIGKVHKGNIQPEIYKAPEVIFDMEWSSSADIWNVGVMIWDIFQDKYLFNAVDEDGDYSASHHVAEMVAYLGLPPLHFIQRSEETRNVFDEKGKWSGAGGVSIPAISLEESEENLHGANKELFLQFVRSMLKWAPEERKTARELLDDPWLNSE